MLIKAKLFFKYLFRFRAPEIRQLNYIDYVIINKSYFLISWKSRYAYKLKIKPFYSTYFDGAGSVYTLVPDGIDSLEIDISNLWHSIKFEILLKKTEISIPFEFTLVPHFKGWHSTIMHLPKPRTSSKQVLVNTTPAKLSRPIFSVQNLTFLKP